MITEIEKRRLERLIKCKYLMGFVWNEKEISFFLEFSFKKRNFQMV